VKGKQTKLEQQLEYIRLELISVSYNQNPTKWSELFEKVKKLSADLSDINRELKLLERKIIL